MLEATACFPDTGRSVLSWNKPKNVSLSFFFCIFQTLFELSSSDSFTQEALDLFFVHAWGWICDILDGMRHQSGIIT